MERNDLETTFATDENGLGLLGTILVVLLVLVVLGVIVINVG